MADIYDELRRDHAELLEMLYDLAERGGDPQRVFPAVYHRLNAHIGAEQDAFYEELLLSPRTHERTLESFVEHRLIAQLLAELAPGDPRDEHWHASLATLRLVFGRHVADEEGPLFDLAYDVLGDERAAAIGGRFSPEKERHMGFALLTR